RRDVARTVPGQVVDRDPPGRHQVAQGAEDAPVEMPEGLEEFLHRVRGVADRVVHGLPAGVAELALQFSTAGLAPRRRGMGIGPGCWLAHAAPRREWSRRALR